MAGDGYITKEANGKYSIQFYYEDRTGERKRKRKCGFKTQRDAKAWKAEFERKAKGDLQMTLSSFVEEYMNDAKINLRSSTCETKGNIIQLHILPYLGNKNISDITAGNIRDWQNQIKEEHPQFSESYLWSINSQLNTIFNYAVKFYNLTLNPCEKAGFMGKQMSGNRGIWNLDEMEKFLAVMKPKTEIYYAFQLLYWTGLRLGELLALNIEDIDFEEGTLSVNKSYSRNKSQDIISDTKTDAGNRTIPLPPFLLENMKDYIDKLYGRTGKDRLFLVTKSHMEKEIKRGAKLANLKEIRVHDLRHSHASLLIASGVDLATISRRMGHQNITTTLRIYGHMFNANSLEAADKLEALYSKEDKE